MSGPQTFSGTGVVYTADGRALQGKRRFSFTLLPYELPPLRGVGENARPRPASIGCFVELFGREPLELEGEPLRLRMADGRWVRFFLFDVSDTPPFLHTTIVEGWPDAAAGQAAGNTSGLRQSA